MNTVEKPLEEPLVKLGKIIFVQENVLIVIGLENVNNIKNNKSIKYYKIYITL